ncbi:MAG TPA: 4Fe-4S binding protein [Anaerolineae bacterium]|nr:4Fe-4S binding protein [Anaerolineae bacterium]
MQKNGYKLLAERLDALPNGFPPTDDGAELRLLAKLFSEEEAALVAQLRLGLETPQQIADRLGLDSKGLRTTLKDMTKRGLIAAGRTDSGLGYGLLPFAIGIYEYQFDKIDEEFARLFEDYYQKAFGQAVTMEPALTRVIPVGETVRVDMEVRPYESVMDIIDDSQAYGVVDCICRTQKALVGDPCDHPVDVCMMLSKKPGAFDGASNVRALTRDGALATLKRASDAGLVHSVSNNQEGLWFICNCCTCSCAVLRSMADLGMANIIARSAFVNQVDEELCTACGICVDTCPFDALTLEDVVVVDRMRCVGCGVCVLTCPEEALGLVRRPADEVLPTPVTEKDWMVERSAARGLDLQKVL